jgi:signal transduction histidine kinase
MASSSPVVLATLGAGVANGYLLWRLSAHRDAPGARWFAATIATQTLWCLAYGGGLLVYDRTLRLGFELLTWVAINWIGVFYVGFALAYTGRRRLLTTTWFRGIVAFAAVSTLLTLTNPVHHLVWTEFEVVGAFDAATVLYDHSPWVVVQWATMAILTASGVVLLLDTVVSYGPLYRRQAAAIAITPVPPALAHTVWVFGLAAPALNLTPVAFLPHVVLDVYALFREDMFEFRPATRRTAERAAIDEVATPVVVLDPDGRVVTLNDAAAATFGVDRRAAQTRPLGTLYDGDPVDPTAGEQDVTVVVDGRRRSFTARPAPLTDDTGAQVGHTVVLQDVTAERQRRQRLDVLNRVLRHNLRNDMTVVTAHADILADALDGDSADSAEAIQAVAGDLAALGEKARQAADTVDGDPAEERVEVAAAARRAADAVRAPHDGDVTVDVPGGLVAVTDPDLLVATLENLAENALEHGGSAVTVRFEGVTDGAATLAVADDGPGIPDHEAAVVASGEESPLEHGSGLGLWVASWAVGSLGGRLEFETPADGGTVARFSLPGVESTPETAGPDADRRPAEADGGPTGVED